MDVRDSGNLNGQLEPFLAMAAHELRAPASIIIGAADTLAELVDAERLGPHGAELVDALRRNGRRLRRLVTDLLTDAYLERGVLPLARDLLPVEPVLHWATKAAGPPEHAVTVECDPLLQAYVDPDRLEQIVTNLVTNAVEHGRPPIEVRAKAVAHGDRIAVVVRDHGVGVDAEAAPLLFERFSPLARRTTRSTGLGLSIARDLARAMGGELTYQCADPGSAFVVELPAHATAS